jgi:hypothetical protein
MYNFPQFSFSHFSVLYAISERESSPHMQIVPQFCITFNWMEDLVPSLISELILKGNLQFECEEYADSVETLSF